MAQWKRMVYSEAFKRQVVEELSRGELSSHYEAAQKYGIGGSATIRRWVKKYGSPEMLAKVVRVESPADRDQLKGARRRIRELEKALADAKVKEVVAQAQYEVLCEELGLNAEEMKKKRAGERCFERE